jgi:hypothetical protein
VRSPNGEPVLEFPCVEGRAKLKGPHGPFRLEPAIYCLKWSNDHPVALGL